MSSDATTNKMDVPLPKKIFRFVLTRVSQINSTSGQGCTLDELTAYIQSKEDSFLRTEDLIEATTQATEILLQQGLLIRCSEGTFRSNIPKFTVPKKDETPVPSSPTITNKESSSVSESSSPTSSSSSSSNSTVADDENFHLEPDRRRSTVTVSSLSSAEEIGRPKKPRKVLKRKGNPVNLPNPRKHRRLQVEEEEPTELLSSDDEPETSYNLERNRGKILKSSFDLLERVGFETDSE